MHREIAHFKAKTISLLLAFKTKQIIEILKAYEKYLVYGEMTELSDRGSDYVLELLVDDTDSFNNKSNTNKSNRKTKEVDNETVTNEERNSNESGTKAERDCNETATNEERNEIIKEKEKRTKKEKENNIINNNYINNNLNNNIKKNNPPDISNDISVPLDKKDEVGDEAKKSKRFIKPTLEEIQAYCEERGNNVDPHKFFDFYESKGWLVGKTPMKNWQACVRTWEKGSFTASGTYSNKESPKSYKTYHSPHDWSSEEEADRVANAMIEKMKAEGRYFEAEDEDD